MTDKTLSSPKRWLNPSTALGRFKPPRGMAPGIAPIERWRARYGFYIGSMGFLIGQDTVSEVLEQSPVYPLPNAPPWLLGLINLRGNLVPVFDIKRFLQLGGGQEQKNRWLMILDQGDRSVGLFIDGLPQTMVINQPLSRLPPLPEALRPHVPKAYMQGNILWMEFNHQSFFQAIGGQIMGTA